MALARSVFVTGSNRGIGLEFVKQLIKPEKAPEHVFAACRSPDKAEDLKKIAEEHKNVHIVKLDVYNMDDIKHAKEIVAKHAGDLGLNVLINNAGMFFPERNLQDVTAEQMMQCYQANVIGPTMLIQEFLPLLQQASKHEASKEMSCAKAAILNMSTIVATMDNNAMKGTYSYKASKIGLNMVNKNLSLELKDDKILAVLLHPGWVQTDMGGSNAMTSTKDSVAGLLNVAQGLGQKDNGLLYDFKGNKLPW
eukprot:gene14983-16529_t